MNEATKIFTWIEYLYSDEITIKIVHLAIIIFVDISSFCVNQLHVTIFGFNDQMRAIIIQLDLIYPIILRM